MCIRSEFYLAYSHMYSANMQLYLVVFGSDGDDVLKDPAQSRREKFKQTKHREAEVHRAV